MTRIISGADVRDLLELADVLSVVEDALLKQGRGEVERPERPHFPVGQQLDATNPDKPLGTGLVMPAYIHGSEYFATKLVSVHPENKRRGLPTIHAQIAVNEAETGLPVAYMDGSTITAARTSCIGGLAARELCNEPISLAVIGAGTQSRWQIRAVTTAANVESVTLYDHNPPMLAEAVRELDAELDVPIETAESPEDAISGATLVITATTSTEPVFSGDHLAPGTTVVGIGAYTGEMQELDAQTIEGASKVFADVPEEVAEIGDILESSLSEDDLIPFSDLLTGNAMRETAEERIVVESVGSAVMDAAVAGHIYDRAVTESVGSELTL
ncbi:ornithine cyclodeaminase family protein [Haladaptatus sp. DJG-WS-42]|uniref:ornithine cyclodeaminase family protein n=1 Tax=Haladaptatus sp. DJG-WS-42 TaxID=3120516 RepID=UPI0030CF386C